MTTDDKELTTELINRLRDYIAAERGRGREIAAQLGVEPSSVSDWTNGRTVPSLEHGLRIQKILARQRRARKVVTSGKVSVHGCASPAEFVYFPTV